jgi:hypothetical protein
VSPVSNGTTPMIREAKSDRGGDEDTTADGGRLRRGSLRSKYSEAATRCNCVGGGAYKVVLIGAEVPVKAGEG